MRPAICMLARHTNDGSKSSQQEAGSRASPWQAPGFVCSFRRHTCMHFRLFAAIEKGLLQRFLKERQGHSQRLWALEAFFCCKAPIWNACESWARLTSFSPAHVQWTASRSGKEWSLSVHRNQYRIRSTETNIAFGPKTKSCRRARQLFFSQSRFSCSWWRKRGQTIRCLRRASTNTQTQKPAVISVCIRLMLGGGDWKPSLFKWEIQHLLKSMGFDAGSRLGGGDWKPSLFKWGIQHLLKSMGFDAGSGLGGVDEQLPPGWALINPAESHQRCWAEIHDPPGMPIFYGWRHGVGRICVHTLAITHDNHWYRVIKALIESTRSSAVALTNNESHKPHSRKGSREVARFACHCRPQIAVASSM